MIERFEDIDVWHDARELCSLVKGLCDNEKFARDFNLGIRYFHLAVQL